MSEGDVYDRLSFDQTAEDNRRAFIARLVAAGWTETAAAVEWDSVQSETEGEL